MSDYPSVSKRATITVTDETLPTPALADPTTLEVTYGKVGGTPTTKTWPADIAIVKDSTGTFHIDIVCATHGQWAVRAEATEGLVGVDEERWVVQPSAF